MFWFYHSLIFNLEKIFKSFINAENKLKYEYYVNDINDSLLDHVF